MQMRFSIPVLRPVAQSPTKVNSNTRPNASNNSLAISSSFNNMFSRLRVSGKCRSCGN